MSCAVISLMMRPVFLWKAAHSATASTHSFCVTWIGYQRFLKGVIAFSGNHTPNAVPRLWNVTGVART